MRSVDVANTWASDKLLATHHVVSLGLLPLPHNLPESTWVPFTVSSPITFILDPELGYNSISWSRYGKILNDHKRILPLGVRSGAHKCG
jgi:hypothetical protein